MNATNLSNRSRRRTRCLLALLGALFVLVTACMLYRLLEKKVKVQDRNLVLTVCSLRVSRQYLTLELELRQLHQPDSWMLSELSFFDVTFFDREGNSISTISIFKMTDFAFLEGRKGRWRLQLEIEIPTGASFVGISFGATQLQTPKMKI